jgi:murein DD-endopeptidase MepM/ murein hydrolase activator NlpD
MRQGNDVNERILQLAVACGIAAGAIVTMSLFFDVVTETAAQRQVAGSAAAPSPPSTVILADGAGTADVNEPSTTENGNPRENETAAPADSADNDSLSSDNPTAEDSPPDDEENQLDTVDLARSDAETDTDDSGDEDSESTDQIEDDTGDGEKLGFDTSESADGDVKAPKEEAEEESDSGDGDDDGDSDADSSFADEDDADGAVPPDDDEEESVDGAVATDEEEDEEEESAATTASAVAGKPMSLTPGAIPPPPPVPSVGAAPTTASQQAALAAPASLKLDMPIRCSPGDDCWIVNYVDLDGSPDVRDYTCAKASYDGHKGTDIAVRDMAAVERGVAVIASAPGIVVGSRDGMPDISFRKIDPKAIKSRECGNGVIIGHPDGWTTQYCHLRKGSIVVAKGDSVDAGQVLGMVGHSGKAEFPHLHFQIRKGAAIVDPFVGLRRAKPCGPGRQPLWKAGTMARLAYQPSAVFNAGFSETPPPGEIGRQGNFHRKVLGRGASKFVLWADVFWVLPGDTLVISVEAPGGKKILNHKVAIQKMRAYRMIAATLRGQGKPWAPGIYRGEVRLERANGLSSAATATVTLR